MDARARRGRALRLGVIAFWVAGLATSGGAATGSDQLPAGPPAERVAAGDIVRCGEGDPQSLAVPHVRPARVGQRRVEALLREAPRRSATVASLLEAIQRSDVVVWVDLREPLANRSGRLTLISANHGYRYLALVLDSRNLGDELIGWLGHELMHVVEVARVPDVRDAATMRQLFSRIACWEEPGRGGFETAAAISTRQIVRAEVAQTPSSWRESERRE
jgi:hypothetical protein